jgi:MscS family membrane protein
MKTRFKFLYFGTLAFLFALAVWSVWSSAQTTNQPAGETVARQTPSGPVAAFGETADRLITQHQDALTFGLQRVPALQGELIGQPLWKYVAAAIYFALALLSARVLDRFISGRLRRWSRKTQTVVDDLLIEILQGPIRVLVVVILLHIGLRMMTWPEALEFYLSLALRLVLAWSLTFMVLKAIQVLLTHWQTRLNAREDRVLDDQLLPLLRKVLSFVVITVAVLLTCDNLGIKITSILAGLSIGGLALGLAAQDTVANLFGAVAVSMDRPFRVGDRVKFDQVDGVVEGIGLRSTRIRNLDGHLVTIPNKTVGIAAITNISRRPHIRTIMTIGLTYDTPAPRVQEARALLEEVYRSHPRTKDLLVGFDKFADFFLNLTIIHWWDGTDYKEYFDGMHELNVRVKERLDAAKINFAFPTQTVYLRQDSEWRMSGSLGLPPSAALPLTDPPV